MRWSYLIPRIVILVVVWSFFAWAFDPILRWSVAKTGGELNGAKVDIADLETRFIPPAVEFHNVQIADRGKPGRNLVQFDSFRLKLAGGPLAHRKLIIDEGEITGLTWNTARSDSGELAGGGRIQIGEHLQFDGLRDRIAEQGKSWLDEAIAAAKAELDPRQLKTVQVSQDLKKRWVFEFQMYEARLKDMENRVKNLKDAVKTQGDTLQKIEAYRQAAIEVQKLLNEAKQLRRELAALGPRANADLKQLELAKQQDLKNIDRKLKILKLDEEAISEALLGPEMVAVLENAMEWVKWSKDKADRLADVKEPERSRGRDVIFPKPVDSHPPFLIRTLRISGKARVDGEMIPYAGTVKNITSDPARWKKPVSLELTTEGRAPIHLTATLDRTADVPVYDLRIEYRLPEPTSMEWGDSEKLAFRISSQETLWTAKLKLAGEQLSGRCEFLQKKVRIEPAVPTGDDSLQESAIQPVSFQWDPKKELRRALAGAFQNVTKLEAAIELSGTRSAPQWRLSSGLGAHVASGVEEYLSAELGRRQAQLVGEIERKADEEIAGFRELVTEKFRFSSERLNFAETEAKTLVQRFSGRSLDVKNLFR